MEMQGLFNLALVLWRSGPALVLVHGFKANKWFFFFGLSFLELICNFGWLIVQLYIIVSLFNEYNFLTFSNTMQNSGKNAKTSWIHFGPGSNSGSAVSMDPNLGPRIGIWVLPIKTNLDPDLSRPDLDSNCCHSYM